ncbi:2585_t:CDS:2, partial [Acaulospora morrowiae]
RVRSRSGDSGSMINSSGSFSKWNSFLRSLILFVRVLSSTMGSDNAVPSDLSISYVLASLIVALKSGWFLLSLSLVIPSSSSTNE